MKKNDNAFPTISLSGPKRLQIKEKCIAAVFKARDIDLLEQKYKLGELVHQHIHTEEEHHIMKTCSKPGRLFQHQSYYHYYVSGYNRKALTRQAKYWCRDLSSSQRSFETTHPVGVLSTSVLQLETNIKADKEVFARELTALLNSCKNTKELITKWPESTQYIGFLFEKKEAPVPVIYSGDHLNQLIAKLQENPQCRTESNQEVQEPSKCKNIQNGKP